MTNKYHFRTDWIKDIEPDPTFIRMMRDRISDAIEDAVDDFAWNIATDYIPAPPDDDEGNSQAYEDAMMDQVIEPLFDLILDKIKEGL